MKRLEEATQHIWFRAYSMLNKVSLNAFLEAETAREMLVHWDFWVLQQDSCSLCCCACVSVSAWLLVCCLRVRMYSQQVVGSCIGGPERRKC